MIPALDAIKARAEAATEGPWSWSGRVAPVLSGYAGTSYRYSKEVIEAEHHGECGCRSACQLEVTVDPLDAEFIAAARSDIPRLVAAIEAVLAIPGTEKTTDWLIGYDDAIRKVRQTVERALKEEQ